MRIGIDAPGPVGPGAPQMRLLSLLAVALLLAGCGQQSGPASPTSAAPPAGRAAGPVAGPVGPVAVPAVAASTSGPTAGPSAGKVAISASDRAACAQLLSRLDQVSVVISASSELIANSTDAAQLGQRIADEAAQLKTAAELMARGPVPAPLAQADQDLVAALRAFTDDFNRAGEAAKRGDLRAAVDAMRDQAAVQRIVAASQTIEDSCQ